MLNLYTPGKLNFYHQQFGKRFHGGLEWDIIKTDEKLGVRVFFYGFVSCFILGPLIPQITELDLFINLIRISH